MNLNTVKCNNHDVADHYYDVICNGFEKAGFSIHYLEKLENAYGMPKNEHYLVGTVTEGFKLYVRGFRKIIIWIQGILPEESYYRNKKIVNKTVLTFIEKFMLKRAFFVFFVSDSMKSHYIRKYKIDFKDRYYIMPCYTKNTLSGLNRERSRYSAPTFTYIGSLTGWQMFETVLEVFKKVQKQIENAVLNVYTRDVEGAEKLFIKHDMKNCTASSLSHDELQIALSKTKYGFLLREDDPINNVATPTKLSDYIEAGVIPICTAAVKYITATMKKTKYKIITQVDKAHEAILKFEETEISPEELSRDYELIIQDYFNDENHSTSIGELIKKVM